MHYAADGDVLVGAVARDRFAPVFPSDTIASVKRFMGRGPRDAEATRQLTPYVFAPGAESDGVVRFAVAGGRAVTPLEVSAEILAVLKARAEAALGGPLEGAVITVPAYFDDGQRQATRDAGRLAGLEVLRLLNEPTAAALAYGLDKQAEGTFAVFDLGGGTFDVSILKLEDGVFEVKATGGDSALGGDDFDRAIADALLARLGLPADAGGDRQLTRRILDAARALKERLTDAPEASLELVIDEKGRRETLRLARAEMEALVRPVLERCAPSVRRALKDAGLEAAALSGVILVGGATRMPLVRRFVEGAVRAARRSPTSIPIRSSRWAPPCRPTSSRARARATTSSCSTSCRCRSASRRWAASSRSSSTATRRCPAARRRRSRPTPTSRPASTCTSCRASARWSPSAARWRASSSRAFRPCRRAWRASR